MTRPTLTQSRLMAGIWEATVSGAGTDAPSLSAVHEGRALPDLQCGPGDLAGSWRIRLALPSDVLCDGLQTIVLRMADGTKIGSLAILAGEPLADDLRAEISLLRNELDLLKSAFRRRYQGK